MEYSKLNIAYTVLIGLFITLFVGLGIAAFYEEPKYPEYPTESAHIDIEQKEPSPIIIEHEKKVEQYEKDIAYYNKNVAIISLIAGLFVLGASFYAHKRKNMFSDSFLIGGIGILLYGTIRGLAAEDLKITFVYVAVSLVVLFFVGYHRFNHPKIKSTK